MVRTLSLGLALATVAWAAHAAPSRDPSGTWLTEDGRARIRMEKCGPANDKLCGYVVWLKVPNGPGGAPKLDAYNPDPSKRGRQALGIQLLQGLKLNGDGRYEGQIYNADDGKSYDVTVWSDSQDEINVRGCLVAFLCKTQAWGRTTDVVAGQLPGPAGSPTGPRPEPAFAKAPQPAATVTAKAMPRKPSSPQPAPATNAATPPPAE